MRTLETTVRANFKVHFSGYAIQAGEEGHGASGPTPESNPRSGRYDVAAAARDYYRALAEITRGKEALAGSERAPLLHPPDMVTRGLESGVRARQKVVAALKGSSEITEVSDLFHQDPFDGLAMGAFAPVFFIYTPLSGTVTGPGSEEETVVNKLYFVYNGRFLMIAGFCDPHKRIRGLAEAVSAVSLQLAKSGYEFRMLSPGSTVQSLDAGVASLSSSPTSVAFNESSGGGASGSALTLSAPRSVSDMLRSVYSASFQHLLLFYSLRERSDAAESLMLTVEAHREAVLDLMREFNKSGWYQFARRYRLRRLIRAHCFNLAEKVGRVDSLSESVARGIEVLEGGIQQEPRLKSALESAPSWKASLPHFFDTRPILDLVARTQDEVDGEGRGLPAVWVAALAAAVGGAVGYLFSSVI